MKLLITMQTSVLSDYVYICKKKKNKEKKTAAGTALTHEVTTLLSLGPPHT